MITRSIWEDTYYVSTENRLTYYIKTDNDVIFAGKAYRLPTDDGVSINISSICRNYMSNDLRPLLDAHDNSNDVSSAESPTGIRIFNLYNSKDVLLETYEFLYDWSYNTYWRGDNMTLSSPINGRVTSTMFKPNTKVEERKVINYLLGGNYEVVNSCNAEYGIYYLNSRGGWDAFLFEGYSTKEDTITQYTTDKSFNNQTYDFETSRYVSEINTSYTLHTSWLNDEESSNFAKNLIGSNNVYLHDLANNKIFPAIITDTKAQYKKMKTNGGKMSLYTLIVKESQNKLRR